MNKIKILILICVLACASAIAHPGVGIVMDSKGNVFYTDLKHIWKISHAGKVSIAVRNVHSHEISIDENDNLFGEHLWYEGEATNKWGYYVWKLSGSGVLEKVIQPTAGFPENYGFARDPYDRTYWADRSDKCQHIIFRDNESNKEKLSDHCFDDIRWMTASPKSNIFLIDRHDLKKVNAQGIVQTLATNLDERKLTQFIVNDARLLMGVWTDNKENAYVAIYGGRMVKKVSPDKKISIVAETSVGWSPTGGFVAPNGDFWLLEYSLANTARVERITPDGKRTIYSSAE